MRKTPKSVPEHDVFEQGHSRKVAHPRGISTGRFGHLKDSERANIGALFDKVQEHERNREKRIREAVDEHVEKVMREFEERRRR